MDCEVCGAQNASSVIKVDGSELLACRNCAGANAYSREKQMNLFPSPQKNPFSGTADFEEISFMTGFGKKIRHAREQKGLTIQELALQLKERESFLHKIEQEKAMPDKQLTGKIEKFFGFKITE